MTHLHSLAELHARLEEEAAQAGFAKETRAFHPHLTVARLRQADNARALATAHKQMEFDPLEIAVAELLVIRSELSSEAQNIRSSRGIRFLECGDLSPLWSAATCRRMTLRNSIRRLRQVAADQSADRSAHSKKSSCG